MSMGELNVPQEMQAEIDATVQAAMNEASPDPGAVIVDARGIARAPKAQAAAGESAKEPAPPEGDAAANADGAKSDVEAKPAAAADGGDDEAAQVGKLALRLRQRERRAIERARAQKAQGREMRARAGALEQRSAQLEAEQKLLGDDPIGWLQKRGYSAEDIAHRLINGGKARPEEGAQRSSREIDEVRAELRVLKEQRVSEQRAAATERELTRFVGEARADAERWPLASQYGEARLRERGLAIAQQARAPISNADILDRIEEELTEIASLRGPAASSSRPTPQPSARAGAQRAAGGAQRQAPGPTLGGIASDGGSDGEPVDFMSLSEDEQRRLVMRELQKAAGAHRARN